MDSAATVDSVSDDLKKQTLEGTENVEIKLKLNLEELNWDNSFVRELPGDPRNDSIPREVCVLKFLKDFVFKIEFFYLIECKRCFFLIGYITLYGVKVVDLTYIFYGPHQHQVSLEIKLRCLDVLAR